MIEKFGIGIDITDVNRFEEKEYKTNTEFYKKIFTWKVTENGKKSLTQNVNFYGNERI